MNPGEKFETSMVGSMGILAALVKRQIGQGSSKSEKFVGRRFTSHFFAICFSLGIDGDGGGDNPREYRM